MLGLSVLGPHLSPKNFFESQIKLNLNKTEKSFITAHPASEITQEGWWRMRTDSHEGVRHTSGYQAGRCLPTLKCRTEPLYWMSIFASNHAVARPHFQYLVSRVKKMKKSVFQETVYCLRSSTAREDLWHLAVLGPPLWHTQHALGAREPNNHWRGHTMFTHMWNHVPCPRALLPDHEGKRGCSQLGIKQFHGFKLP